MPEHGRLTTPGAGDDGPTTPAPRWLMDLGGRLAVAATAVGLERAARLVAVAVTPLLLDADERTAYGALLLGLVVYVLVTGLASRNRYLRGADLVVAAVLIALTGPSLTSFMPFLLVAVAGPAAQGGLVAGIAAGTTLAIVAGASLAHTGAMTMTGLASFLTIVLVLLLVGVTTALASRVLEDRELRGRQLLARANRLLSSLRAIAEELPGGLDVATVSSALAAEIRSYPAVRAVYVLTQERRGLRVTAVSGADGDVTVPLRHPELTRGRARIVEASALPAKLDAARACPVWVILPLRNAGSPAGTILVGADDAPAARRLRRDLATLTHDGAVALQNARLFDDTQQRAVDTARRRIASDLHDGVAQGLAHLRMELELLARRDDTNADELARLSRVAHGALLDLRRTISGLRADPESDVGRLIDRHVTDVAGATGAAVRLRQDHHVTLRPDHAEEVLRIVQEAVSNAVRHGAPGSVVVTLDGDDDEVRVTIDDDGVGFTATASAGWVDATGDQPHPAVGAPRPPGEPTSGSGNRDGTGVGLASMAERAERLGGVLTITDVEPHGTRVHLTVPTDIPPPPGRTVADDRAPTTAPAVVGVEPAAPDVADAPDASTTPRGGRR